MNWEIISVGKPSLLWARDGAQDYQTRLRRKVRLSVTPLRENPAATLAGRMLDASAGAWRIVLDERGKTMSSMAFAQWIGTQEMAGRKRVCVLVGGANGHADAVRAAADEVWSLSPMTLQHELALVVFLEQLYRACAIRRGEPYHRD